MRSMRTVYLVRHGLSQANNRENIGTPAFGAADAELMPAGIEHANAAGRLLVGKYALLQVKHVAVSTMRRSQQTAEEAGFADFTEYSQLDEVPIKIDETTVEQRANWHERKFDDFILEHALATLALAPKEPIWFTHGLRIAGICSVLDQHQEARPIPRFGEVREVAIDT